MFSQRSCFTALLVLSVAGLCLILASPLSAEAYRIKLKNGNEFMSAYRPIEAHYDAAKMLVMTEVGNVIALSRDDIAEVVHDLEVKGFGRVINTTTIEIGWAANDAMSDEELQAAYEGLSPAQQMMLSQGDAGGSPVYNTQQFAEPNSGGGGVPVSFATSGMMPMGSASAPVDE